MPDVSLLAALAIGKGAGLLSRSLRVGGGTTLPGNLARRLAPSILRDLAAALPEGVVLVTGTNGKTTTTRMIAEALRASGRQVLHNRAGANLVSGLTATALADCDLLGRPRSKLGLFETDEAALPQALSETAPRLVLIHNLFRDQLDRYGEVDTVATAWRSALVSLPASSRVLLNADDPAVAELGSDLTATVQYYGLEDQRHAGGSLAHSGDSLFCRRCGTRFQYPTLFYAHIGHYLCPGCGYRRPAPQFRLERLDVQGSSGSRLLLSYPGGAMELQLPLPGLYNAVNALAALAACLNLGLTPQQIRNSLEGFSAAFGRIERLRAGPDGPPLLIALIKNPVGASETLRMLGSTATAATPLHLLIAINDRYADGTDVSWLWDADFEQLGALPVAQSTVAGTRAADMAVRLKYAGVDPARITVVPELAAAVDAALQTLPAGATLYIVPTYTAMLELRAELSRRGWVRPFWDT